MNTAAAIAEIHKRLDNLLRIGTVAEVKGHLCRVKTGNLTTDYRPFLTQRAGTARTSWRPTVGEQVMLLSLSGDLLNAYVLPAIYSVEHPEPDDDEARHRTIYPDGAVIEYDPTASALTVKGIKTATVQASDKVTVDCPNVVFTGDVLIEGTATVQKKLTAKSGADVDGAIKHQGKLTNKGGVNVDNIEFGLHKHPIGTPTTGMPIP